MGKVGHPSRQAAGDDRRARRVVDDFPADVSVGAAELDAVEAFLMPLVHAIMSGTPPAANGLEKPVDAPLVRSADSQGPQKSGLQGR
ncbi:hypothetical protein [Methylocella tundrae]|uniref:hypothetical protein n=1 Tax=Methylocella tundrae TaxID=227605 RepID=UPI00106AB0DA|nr:hypothetical protein [Methylocella tundrae]WPP04528.1 hypothetical protein SIN04_19205 [Methylocella tundrae]